MGTKRRCAIWRARYVLRDDTGWIWQIELRLPDGGTYIIRDANRARGERTLIDYAHERGLVLKDARTPRDFEGFGKEGGL